MLDGGIVNDNDRWMKEESSYVGLTCIRDWKPSEFATTQRVALVRVRGWIGIKSHDRERRQDTRLLIRHMASACQLTWLV